MPEREEGNPPSQEEETGTPPEQRVLPAHGMPEREEGNPPSQEEETGTPPEQRVLPAHGMQGRGGPPNSVIAPRGPPSSVHPQRTVCRYGKEKEGRHSSLKERGGGTL